MRTGKSKRRRQEQQQSGRPVLVTFYIERPTRDGGGAATASAHHHLHGGGHESRVRGCSKQKVEGRSYNRRAGLLEYSRRLRAQAGQTTAATAATQPAAPPPRPLCSDTTGTVGVLPDADVGQQKPAAVRRRSLSGRPHERTRSQQQRQQIRHRRFGNGGGWSWKRVFVLVFPFNSSSHSIVDGSKSRTRRPTRRHDYGRRESNTNNNQKGWAAALLLGKLTDKRTSGDRIGLGKKLMSVLRQR